jgi:hypothetical protein
LNAVFSVQKKTSDVFLVLIVNKVLQGDPEEARDAYIKMDALKTMKQKDFDKQIETFCQRLGGYRQQFCWSAAQVFDDSGNLLLKEDNQWKELLGVTVKDIPHLIEQLAELKVNIFLRACFI